MTNHGRWIIAAAAAVFAACSTPQSRIRKNQAAFDAYPPEVQQEIRQGRIDIGFTPGQVAMALGKPDGVSTRKTAAGIQKIWAYGNGAQPVLSFGFGWETGWPGFYNADAGVEPVFAVPYDLLRVIFENGKVIAIEKREN